MADRLNRRKRLGEEQPLLGGPPQLEDKTLKDE